jgi:superfamily II DNA helicase RecQ
VSELHCTSENRCRRSALASLFDTSGTGDTCSVLVQQDRMRSVLRSTRVAVHCAARSREGGRGLNSEGFVVVRVMVSRGDTLQV